MRCPAKTYGETTESAPALSKVFLRHFLAGARHDPEIGVEAACGQHDVEIGGIGRSRGDEAARMIQCALPAEFVPASRRRSSMSQFSAANFWALASLFSMMTNGAGRRANSRATLRPDASGAAQNVVIRQTADLALHAPPSKEALQLEF